MQIRYLTERIYERVWGYEAEGDSGVVKEHIRKNTLKSFILQLRANDYNIETVWGVGLQMESLKRSIIIIYRFVNSFCY